MAQILMLYLICPDKSSKSAFCEEMIETVIKVVESRKVRYKVKDKFFPHFSFFLFEMNPQIF